MVERDRELQRGRHAFAQSAWLQAYEALAAAYRRASALRREPQPGLALLRLAQGYLDAAAAAIRRAVTETVRPLERATELAFSERPLGISAPVRA